MPFRLTDFNRVLKQDNPNYERIKDSSLHALVEVLKKTTPMASEVEREMKKIPKEKWKKYARTRHYILTSFDALVPEIVDFKTERLTAGAAGAIVHVLKWKSSTGDLNDLAHIKVREHVSWDAPNMTTRPYLDPAYQVAGRHYGVGNAAFTPGSTGQGDDTHAALGPFTPQILKLPEGTELEFEMDQVYEFTVDGFRWEAIPRSNYRILRTVTKDGERVRLTIRKSGGQGESLENSTQL